jgi:hypothetical protein
VSIALLVCGCVSTTKSAASEIRRQAKNEEPDLRALLLARADCIGSVAIEQCERQRAAHHLRNVAQDVRDDEQRRMMLEQAECYEWFPEEVNPRRQCEKRRDEMAASEKASREEEKERREIAEQQAELQNEIAIVTDELERQVQQHRNGQCDGCGITSLRESVDELAELGVEGGPLIDEAQAIIVEITRREAAARKDELVRSARSLLALRFDNRGMCSHCEIDPIPEMRAAATELREKHAEPELADRLDESANNAEKLRPLIVEEEDRLQVLEYQDLWIILRHHPDDIGAFRAITGASPELIAQLLVVGYVPHFFPVGVQRVHVVAGLGPEKVLTATFRAGDRLRIDHARGAKDILRLLSQRSRIGRPKLPIPSVPFTRGLLDAAALQDLPAQVREEFILRAIGNRWNDPGFEGVWVIPTFSQLFVTAGRHRFTGRTVTVGGGELAAIRVTFKIGEPGVIEFGLAKLSLEDGSVTAVFLPLPQDRGNLLFRFGLCFFECEDAECGKLVSKFYGYSCGTHSYGRRLLREWSGQPRHPLPMPVPVPTFKLAGFDDDLVPIGFAALVLQLRGATLR